MQLGSHPDKTGVPYLGVRVGWMVMKRIEQHDGGADVAVPASVFQIKVESPGDQSAPPPPKPLGERI